MIAFIDSITIMDEARVASVISPQTGKRHSHGLGAVGEPILPFLGDRSEGYRIAFGDAPPEVREIDRTGRPNARGRYPLRRRPWAALGAPDLTLAGWSSFEAAPEDEAHLTREHDEAADRHFGPSQN